MSLESDPVTTLYADFSSLMELLVSEDQASSRNFVDGNFRKVLLLSAASHFEKKMVDCLRE